MGFAEWLAECSRFGLGLVFLLAGAAKLVDLRAFRRAVAEYRLLPDALAKPVGGVLPFLEVLTAIALVLGVRIGFVTLGVLALLGAFSLAVGVNLVRGRELDCACFGTVLPVRLTWWTVMRNLLLMAMAALVLLGPQGGLGAGLSGPSAGAPAREQLAAAALGFATVAGVIVGTEAVRVRERLRAFTAVAATEGPGA